MTSNFIDKNRQIIASTIDKNWYNLYMIALVDMLDRIP
jgi:hypothetical protein